MTKKELNEYNANRYREMRSGKRKWDRRFQKQADAWEERMYKELSKLDSNTNIRTGYDRWLEDLL